MHWQLRNTNANDVEVQKVAKKMKKKLEPGDVVIWDQLGRSGRTRNPRRQHFNPEVIQSIKDMGAEVMHLPPKGKYWNPAELLFNDLKNHYIRPAYCNSGKPMSRDKLMRIMRKYMRDVAPEKLPGFFRARANGAELSKLNLL